jgi:hypothetical protein
MTIDYTKPLETTCGNPVRLLSDEPLKGWESADILPGIIMDGRAERACEVLRHSDEVWLMRAGCVYRFDLRNVPPRMVKREAWMVVYEDGTCSRRYDNRSSAEDAKRRYLADAEPEVYGDPGIIARVTWQEAEQ